MRVIDQYLKSARCPNVGAAICRALGNNDILIKETKQGAAAAAPAINKYLTQYQAPAAPAAGPDNYRLRWLPLYAAMNYNRGQLDRHGRSNNAQAKKYRAALAAQVLHLEKQVNEIWARADYHNLTGHAYQAPGITAQDASTAALMINKLTRRLQRLQRLQPGQDVTQAIKQTQQQLNKLMLQH